MKLRPLTEKERTRFMQLCTWARLREPERRLICLQVAGDECRDRADGHASTRAPGWNSHRFVRLMAAVEAELCQRVGVGDVPHPRGWRDHGYWQRQAAQEAAGVATTRQWDTIKDLWRAVSVTLPAEQRTGVYLRGIASHTLRRSLADWQGFTAADAGRLIGALRGMLRQRAA